MTEQTFTCDYCGGTFPMGPEDEAQAERDALWGQEVAESLPMAVVCDDCWKAMGFGGEDDAERAAEFRQQYGEAT